jgi:hypothetical protein
MKLRSDFVTNSSSTSFVIICNGELTLEKLRRLLGVEESSPLAGLAVGLLDALKPKLRSVEGYRVWAGCEGDVGDAWIAEEFSNEVAERVGKARQKGAQVYMGCLDSDGDEMESFFCCDAFEVENEEMYLNALNCVW